MNKYCGSCMYRGDVKADRDGARLFCFYDNAWHPDVYSCDKWNELASNLSKEIRLQMATKLKENEIKKNQKKMEVFPFKPDGVKESIMHIIEDGELDTDGQINDLIHFMFEYQERSFYLFHQVNKPQSAKLLSAKEQNIILLDEVECFYYKHPKHQKDYVKISGNNPKFDWRKEVIEKEPEYHRITLKLTQKAKRDLEISYKKFKEKQQDDNPFIFEPNFYGIGVKLKKVLPWIKKSSTKKHNNALHLTFSRALSGLVKGR